MKLCLGCDHGGFELKEQVLSFLKEEGHEVVDVGCYAKERCDYPLFAFEAAKLVANKEVDFGILICTSGEGICMAANKVKGIRCGLGYNDEVSGLIRAHNDANMISFGAAFTTLHEAKKRIKIFLSTEFLGERHAQRVDLIKNFEK